jgi:hypothetical protein
LRVLPFFVQMTLSNAVKSTLVVALAIFLLCRDNLFSQGEDFILKDGSLIYEHENTNSAGHVYPYSATIISMTCLLILVAMIICYGDSISG